MTRKLAAIVAADVVGSSRLMGADEAGTLAALKTLWCGRTDLSLLGLARRVRR